MKKWLEPRVFSRYLLVVLFIAGSVQFSFAQAFTHPGLLVSETDFSRIKQKVSLGEEPWVGGLKTLEDNWHSSSTYSIRGPADTIYRGNDGVHGQNFMILAHDASAAYANALRWKIRGTEENAKKSVEILNAYANKLKAIGGSTDAMLVLGLQGYQLANAAEIMRTYDGWNAEELKTFQTFMMEVFYGLPTNPHYNGIRRFLAAHNGTQDGYYWANWDLCVLDALIAIAILCDNRDVYNDAISYFKSGGGNGNITKLVNFVYDGGLGQWQESGRDQGHTSMGPPLMAIFCEMAWKQGDDLYGYDDNRLLKGSEYVAKYNLGNAVPFTTYNHPKNFGGTEAQTVISDASRNAMRTGWDLIYNHYVIKKGLRAPYSQIAAYTKRPDGGPWNGNSGEFDLIGYTTLTSSLDRGAPKKEQTIVWRDTSIALRGPDMELGAKASSGYPCYYTLSDYSMAEIINNKLHPYKAGTINVTAWQPGDGKYAESVPVTRQITIVDSGDLVQPELNNATVNLILKSTSMCAAVPGSSTAEGSNIIQWRCTTGKEQKWVLQKAENGAYYILNVNSGMALTVKDQLYTSGTMVEQRTKETGLFQTWDISINSDGSFDIINHENQLALGAFHSNISEGSAYAVETPSEDASQKFTITIEKKNQLISFGLFEPAHPNDPGLLLTAKSSSGLPITYVSTNPELASVSNDTLYIHKSGTVGVIAAQQGNGEYNTAFDVTQWLDITKRSQTILVPELLDLHAGDPNREFGATATSGLPLNVSSSDPLVAQYDANSNSFLLKSAGSSLISLTQEGNDEYSPAFLEFELLVGKAADVAVEPISSTSILFSRDVTIDYTNDLFRFSMDSPSRGAQVVSVFDMTGKKWSVDQSRSGSSLLVNLSSLPAGLYFLRLVNGNNNYTYEIRRP